MTDTQFDKNYWYEHQLTDITLRIINATSMRDFCLAKGKLLKAKEWDQKIVELEVKKVELQEKYGDLNE